MNFSNLKTTITLKLKKILENLPRWLSKYFIYIPFSIRLGKQYSKTKKEIKQFNVFTTNKRKEYIFQRFRKIVKFAIDNIEFYNDFYKKNEFSYDQLKSFDDIKRVPVIKKSDLKEYFIEERSSSQKGRMKINTGGTSGEPLDFHLDSNAFAREWAHMHYIWSKLDYKRTDTKLTLRGKNLKNKLLKYNAVHNEYIVNTYKSIDEIGKAIYNILKKENIFFLHGYPSEIYNFACYCSNNQELNKKLNENLKGILLGSEYPAPVYRDKIENTFKCPSISWYGHSEMAVLAYESDQKYIYEPMHTYGYCETAKDENGNDHLIGTSYYNTASPFIRYDTGDLVKPLNYEDGLLTEFKIKTGRVGNFIVDSNGENISLTALIFGRHHEIFNTAKFVQVYQRKTGEASIIVTLPAGMKIKKQEIKNKFDLSNVNIDFKIILRDKPIKTKSGKVPLRVNSLQY